MSRRTVSPVSIDNLKSAAAPCFETAAVLLSLEMEHVAIKDSCDAGCALCAHEIPSMSLCTPEANASEPRRSSAKQRGGRGAAAPAADSAAGAGAGERGERWRTVEAALLTALLEAGSKR